MSNEFDTGGPAFPRPGDFNPQLGMTLRDYFAAHATEEDICVALDSVKQVETVKDSGKGYKVIRKELPENARQIARYIHADLMLKARGSTNA